MPYTLVFKLGLIFQYWESRITAIWVTMVKSIRVQGRRASAAICFLMASLSLTGMVPTPVFAADKVELSIDLSKTGAKIDRNLFGQFAEHLGHGVMRAF